MPEVAVAGEHHGEPRLVRRLNDLGVAHRPARLDDGGGPRLRCREQSVRERLSAGDYPGAHAAASADTGVFAQVCAGAFSKIGLGKDPVDDAIFEEIERERGAFNSRVSYLSVIGVITPMIGLTGTVFGMIQAFEAISANTGWMLGRPTAPT